MRLILHNPQKEIFFGKTLISVLTRAKSFRKYKYLLDYVYKNNKDFAIYIDSYGSSLPYINKFFPQRLEIFLWAYFNGLNPFKIKIITNIDQIKNDDIFFSFTYFNLDGQNKDIYKIADKKFLKIFHATHFIMRTTEIAENFKKLRADFFAVENNLAKNSPYFKKYFPYYKNDVYTLPFVFEERFQPKVAFSKRKNLCFATGTIVRFTEMPNFETTFKDFMNFYKTDTIHPLRAEIYNNKKDFKGLIDSTISPLWEVKRSNLKGNENIFKWFYSKFHNAFMDSKRKYYQFSMVDKFNQYKMFVVPEEINDLPGIGFVEGMACGCAYIGKIDPMYTDLGLIPGKHYIGYDGSVKDLKTKIKYYQKNNTKLEKIAKEGTNYIRKNFNGDEVARKFWSDMTYIVENYKKTNYNKELISIRCSMVSI